MRHRRGFTLIELLAATALFAILGTLLFQVVRSAMDVWATGERNRELEDRASAVLELLAEDLRASWPGTPGAVEQDARFLCTYREQDADHDGHSELRTPVLRFARLCHEQRALSWLRDAGDVAGAEGTATLLGVEDPAELRPTGGLAESLYTVVPLPGRRLPSLLRRFRAPIGGVGSLLDAELLERPERLVEDAIVVADQVLYFGVQFWAPGVTHWDRPGDADADADVVPALFEWDSTRALLPPGDPGFPYGVGPASLEDGSDDLFPRLVRVTLVLDRDTGGSTSGALAETISAETGRLRLASTTFLRNTETVDHLLIDSEWMAVLGMDGPVVTVRRGVRGSVPAVHDGGAGVRVGHTFTRTLTLPAGRENYNG